MKVNAVNKIRKNRLARKAQINSGLHQEIKILREKIVKESFSTNFDSKSHQSLMNKIAELKKEHRKLALQQNV